MEVKLDFLTVQITIAFILAMVRVLALIMTAPVFNRREFPTPVKLGFAVIITILLYTRISNFAEGFMPTDMWSMSLALLKEIFIGASIGMLTNLIIDAMASVAQIAGVQMSQSASNVFDPSTQTSLNPTALFYTTIAALSFLLLNGHHNLIELLAKTFEIFPIASNTVDLALLGDNFIEAFSQIFIIGTKFMLPIVGAMLLADVVIAIVAKVLPQANMFFLFMPTKLILGMLLMSLMMASLLANLDQYFNKDLFTLFDSLL